MDSKWFLIHREGNIAHEAGWSGPGGGFDDAVWLDNDTFVIAGSLRYDLLFAEPPADARNGWVAALSVCALRSRQCVSYRSTEIATDSSFVYVDEKLRRLGLRMRDPAQAE